MSVHTAAEEGNIHQLLWFINRNRKLLEHPDDAGNTPLLCAVMGGQLECVNKLLELGARTDCINSYGATPLHYAARNGNPELLELLISRDRKNLDKRDKEGWTPLHYAVVGRSLVCAKKLIDQGADVSPKNAQGLTPLHLACSLGAVDCIRLLAIDHNAPIEILDNEGNTPFALLSLKESPAVVVSSDCAILNSDVQHLTSEFRALVDAAEYSDIRVVSTPDATFHAHRVILSARSPYFRKALAQSPRELTVHASPVVVRALLEYLYCGSVDADKLFDVPHVPSNALLLENGLSLFVLAGEHELPHLADYAEGLVAARADHGSVAFFSEVVRHREQYRRAGRLFRAAAEGLFRRFNEPAYRAVVSGPERAAVLDALLAAAEIVPRFRREGMTAAEREFCRELIGRLMSHKESWPFNNPVDPVALGLPDYFDVIRQPMDLGTIRKRVDTAYYDVANEFADDVRLTFQNAVTYNQPGSDICRSAERLLKLFEKHWAARPPDVAPSLAAVDKPKYAATKKLRRSALAMPPPAVLKAEPAAPANGAAGPMSLRQKQLLGEKLSQLDDSQMLRVIDIIKEKVRQQNSANASAMDDIELDLNDLDDATLWRLDAYVESCLHGNGCAPKPPKTASTVTATAKSGKSKRAAAEAAAVTIAQRATHDEAASTVPVPVSVPSYAPNGFVTMEMISPPIAVPGSVVVNTDHVLDTAPLPHKEKKRKHREKGEKKKEKQSKKRKVAEGEAVPVDVATTTAPPTANVLPVA